VPNLYRSASSKESRPHGLTPFRTGITAACVVLVLLAVTYSTAIKNQLDSWKLLPQPERLTELYFSHSNDLPSTYTPGQTQVIDFTLHNLEYRATSYTYTIIQSGSASSSRPIGGGQVELSQDQSTSLAIPVKPLDLGMSSQLEVEVTFQGTPFGAASLSSESISVSYPVNRVGTAS
jgi:hypothetical protein